MKTKKAMRARRMAAMKSPGQTGTGAKLSLRKGEMIPSEGYLPRR